MRVWTATGLSAQLASDAVLDGAFDWLCRRRLNYSANADVWALRRDWSREKQIIRNELAAGDYRFSLLSRVTLSSGEDIDLWAARDALVLKALTLVLTGALPVSPRCIHIKGHGGAKLAVREVCDHLKQNRFVLRTDVKSYYASIDHLMLLDQLAVYIRDRRLLNLLGQYLRRTSERGGSFWDFEKGISLGCPLSPLMGAFFLYELDTMMARAMGRNGPFYVRYMDDILVLSRTRWGLRRAVAAVNRVLQRLDLSQHPDKTFIGRIERGFDFLGYHFSRDADGVQALGLADITVAKFKEKLFRLYEQARHATTSARSGRPRGIEPSSFDIIATQQLNYVRRWLAWAHGGLNNAAADSHFSRITDVRCGCERIRGV
jgi:RNA-directed DNA polymerase